MPGGCLPGRGVCLMGGLLARGSPCWGGLPAGESPYQGGLHAGGSSCWGVSLVGGLPARGLPTEGVVSLQRGVSLAGGGSPPETPPVDRITDTSENITLATTSLRPVMNVIWHILSGNDERINSHCLTH